MPETDLSLLILARVDAIFWPVRSRSGDIRRAVAERRREYLDGGLPWAVGGNTAARQAASRELTAAADAGYISLRRERGKQAVRVRLTSAHEEEVRSTTCIGTFSGALPLLANLVRLVEDGHGYRQTDGIWLRETTLARVAYGDPGVGKVLGGQAERLLPLMVRGFVESNADLHGRVWYRVTPAGAGYLRTKGAISTELPPPAMVYEDDCSVYISAMDDALASFASAEPADPREIGPIPMPAGVSDDPKASA